VILVLRKCQVQDPNRGSFYVKVQPVAKAKHLGHQVYQDVNGVRFIVEDDDDL
jgi:hypothetical protein